MKNLAILLVVLMAGAMGLKASTLTSFEVVKQGVSITMPQADEKPCPADCKCENCTKKDGKTGECPKKAECKSADAATKSADCKKGEAKSGCCAGAKASTTTPESKESTDKK